MVQNPKEPTMTELTMEELKSAIDLTKIRELVNTLPRRRLNELNEEWLTYVNTINRYITLQNLKSGNDISLRLLNSTEEGRQFLGNFIQFTDE